MMNLTQGRLKELLNYDPETGKFIRKGGRYAGKVVGWVMNYGYIHIGLDGRRYLAHRLAWLFVHGTWPEAEIDHINGNKTDNRLSNLRDVSKSLNQLNRKAANRSNTNGYLGVSWHKGTQKFAARLAIDKKRRTLGYFDTPQEAHAAYLLAKSNACQSP